MTDFVTSDGGTLLPPLCECCQEPCDEREPWAIAIDGGFAHHSCLRDHGVCGTLIDQRDKETAWQT